MTNQNGVALTAAGAILLCVIHFFSVVYLAGEPQQRELDPVPIALPDNALPYNADTLQQLIAQWVVPAPAESAAEQVLANPLAGYDNTRLGDTQIALLAIYRQKQPTAVLALQSPGQPLRFVRLVAGDNVGDITLSQVSGRDVTITRGAQQVTLRLFNPGSASSE